MFVDLGGGLMGKAKFGSASQSQAGIWGTVNTRFGSASQSEAAIRGSAN